MILVLLIYLGYQLFKKWAVPGHNTEPLEGEDGLRAVDDVMVKDPFCQAYFPRRQGVREVINGKTYYFCSTVCRDKFLDKVKQSGS